MRERKIFEQPLGGQLSPAQQGSVKKSLEGAVNPAHAGLSRKYKRRVDEKNQKRCKSK